MIRFDRLTALMNRFTLSVEPAPVDDAALLVLAAADGRAGRVLFRAAGEGFVPAPEGVIFSACVDWGGKSNPLIAALPTQVMFDVTEDADSRGVIALMQSEFAAQRCGAGSVVNRLGEVLIIRMLRAQIEAGATRPGLLAGLSDPRISRAIVAIHDHPGRIWRNEDLAQIAGLSLSRFAEMFLDKVGEPPAVYLRRWRLTLARQDLVRGDRVEAIARRYGYASPEGFARAFRKHFGETPIALRPRPAA
jgi:AraC-like DNA-binding protein